MTAVYRFVPTRDDQPFLALANPGNDGDELLRFFDGSPKLGSWSPPEVTWDGPSDGDVDFLSFNYSPCPVVSPLGREFLERVNGEWVEFLPLEVSGEELWLAHVLLVADCLDVDRTDYRSSGLPYRYAFEEEELQVLPAPLFKLSQVRSSEAFATASFKAEYDATGLAGFQCKAVPQVR